MMRLDSMLPYRTALCGLMLVMRLVTPVTGSDLSQMYCSNQNTGEDHSSGSNIYQSAGSCSDSCQGGNYAFAVVQYSSCWCTNYAPYAQQDTGDCNQPCPGYPDNLCGNANDGLFGYLPLGNPASGTLGAPSSTQAPTTSSTYDPPPPSSTSEPPPSTSSSISPPPSSSSAPPASLSSSSSSTTTSHYGLGNTNGHTSTASVQTIVRSISGAAVTQTVTSTPLVINGGSSSDSAMALSRKGLSGGAIAGVVIGTLLGVAALFIAAFLLWRRRKQADAEDGTGARKSPKRNTSVLSRTGLLARARPQSMAENNYDDTPIAQPQTSAPSMRHSMLYGAGLGGEGVSPVSPLGSNQDVTDSRRQSKPLVYDQRLNPSALWMHHDNSSRVSMQDQQDYSRPLGVANPDFRSSFDSRISR